MNSTTKRFARSMDEAFPKGLNYACAVQRTRTDSKLFDIALAVSIGLALCGLVLEWWL